MNSDELLPVPIYSALNKTNLFMGGERELMLFTGLISFTLIFTGMTIITFVVGVALWLFVSIGLRMMAKKDPIMSKVYMRQIHYASFYPPFSTPYRKEKN